MVLDFLEHLPDFLKHNLADTAKVLIGAFLVGFLALKWGKSIRRATKAQIEAERQKLAAQLAENKADYHRGLAEQHARLTNEKYETQKDLLAVQRTAQEVAEECARLSAELNALQKRLSDLESFDGRLWERPCASAPPSFIDRTRRKTNLIAIVNLKGGVGKTTLTANLGVTLARRGRRVLLVDLDFQGSLTRLCLGSADREHLLRKGLTASRLLDGEAVEAPGPVQVLAQRVRSVLIAELTCEVICAEENLAEAELRAQARWLVSQQPDARFLLREALHIPEVLAHYDYVLFDCPPRLTTACVNALACCDYVMIPVLLEQGSVEALPRTLAWLTRLPHVSQARVLGVIANRAEFYRDSLIAAQQTIYNYLPQTIERAGIASGCLFRAIVRNKRNLIEDAANHGRIAAGDDAGLALFAGVADEVEKGTAQ
jgi:cellulose biosynthesis protein BcsQ